MDNSLNLNFLKIVKEYNLQKYYKTYNHDHFNIDYYNSLDNLINYYEINVVEYTRAINRNSCKFYRLSKKIELLLSLGQCWFCTWTINDESMKFNHRRKLKEIYKGLDFIINVDYAPKTNRKHYHGIILSETEPAKWEYGFCKFIKVNNSSPFLVNYMFKFTRHALKVDSERIIYSRKGHLAIFNKMDKMDREFKKKHKNKGLNC